MGGRMISQELEISLNQAVQEAQKRKHAYVSIEHVLFALLKNPRICKIVEGCGGLVQDLNQELEGFFSTKLDHAPSQQNPQPTVGFQRVLQRAAQQVLAAGKDKIYGDAVLISILSEKESYAAYFLLKQNISRFDLIQYIAHNNENASLSISEHSAEKNLLQGDEWEIPVESNKGSDSHAREAIEEPETSEKSKKRKTLLEAYTVDLCEKVTLGKIDPIIGRKDELERTIQVLCRRKKNNPLFVGESGVGKTAIAEGLASKIVQKEVPEVLRGAKVYALDLGSLLAGTKFRGDFEQRLKGLIQELKEIPHSILFIDEIHTIIGAGAVSGGAMDASNILKPFLASGEIRCIGSTTYKEYRQYIENDHALSRRFQRIPVEEPSQEDALAILKGLKKYYEDYHHVQYSAEALKGAVELSSLHLKDQQLPDKAIDVIDEVGARFSLKKKPTTGKIQTINLHDIKETISKMARIPLQRLTTSGKSNLQDLGNRMRAVVFGQDSAVESLESVIKLSRSGLARQDRPIGCFLFAGPTGVGKTELAKVLAQTLGISFIRLDMSEYMERHAVSRLIGAPPGYVGYEEGGLLTDQVHKHPHAVLLLDEIEKAHPDVHNILLQIMDHGTLTDSNGRKTDFQSIILIMTTNVGAAELARESIGFTRSQLEIGRDKAALTQAFSPEFRNRLDRIVTFGPLAEVTLLQIVDKFLGELRDQLEKKRVVLFVSEEAKKWLGKKGYDAAYGARPMHRTIQDWVKKPLVEELLFGKLVKGGTVSIEVKEDALIFNYS